MGPVEAGDAVGAHVSPGAVGSDVVGGAVGAAVGSLGLGTGAWVGALSGAEVGGRIGNWLGNAVGSGVGAGVVTCASTGITEIVSIASTSTVTVAAVQNAVGRRMFG